MRRGMVKKTVHGEYVKGKGKLVIHLCKIMNSVEQARQVFPSLLITKERGTAFETENSHVIQTWKVELKLNLSKLMGRNASSLAASWLQSSMVCKYPKPTLTSHG